MTSPEHLALAAKCEQAGGPDREALLAAKAGFDALFRPAPQHRVGCLFREDRRMPCQCGFLDRERAAMSKAQDLCLKARDLIDRALASTEDRP